MEQINNNAQQVDAPEPLRGPVIFVVAVALRATATAELSYSLIDMLAHQVRRIGEVLRLLPDSCLLADSRGANKSLKRLSRVACDASRPPQPAPPLSSAVTP